MTVSPTQLDAAAARLRAGGLVAFPTETVYGLGADAANPEAVARVFALKGRPADHPLIVHLGRAEQLAAWVAEPPEAAWRLAERFWPGPLTLVLPKAAGVPGAVTGGQDSIAVRVPGHPVALALLGAFGGGIAAPSANRFGRVSPTTAQHVRDEFGADAPLVLDGGPCGVGLESTILHLCGAVPTVLRPGAITAEALSGVLGVPVRERPAPEAPRVPGALESHYAPTTPFWLASPSGLAARLAGLAGRRVALVSAGPPPAGLGAGVSGVPLPGDATGYGQQLYATLRRLDAEGFEAIVAVTPPEGAAWEAARDRLWRAAGLGGAHTLEERA
jgi:L-threonylcarbamoyladenylate synthase